MPKILSERVTHGLTGALLWQVSVRWESDRTITRWGETLSGALSKLALAIGVEERNDGMREDRALFGRDTV